MLKVVEKCRVEKSLIWPLFLEWSTCHCFRQCEDMLRQNGFFQYEIRENPYLQLLDPSRPCVEDASSSTCAISAIWHNVSIETAAIYLVWYQISHQKSSNFIKLDVVGTPTSPGNLVSAFPGSHHLYHAKRLCSRHLGRGCGKQMVADCNAWSSCIFHVCKEN